MSVDSLIILAKPCPFFLSMVKLFLVAKWLVVVWWSCMGESFISCSLYLFANVLVNSLVHSSSHSAWLHLNEYIIPLLHCTGSLSFHDTNMFLIALLGLEDMLILYLLHMPLMPILRCWSYGMAMYPLYVLFWLLLFCCSWCCLACMSKFLAFHSIYSQWQIFSVSEDLLYMLFSCSKQF